MNLFTYGSLMFPEIWLRVAGRVFSHHPARVHDYAAYKVRGEVYPGLAACPGAVTSGVVYMGLDKATLARLDAFEGSYYERLPLTAIGPDQTPLAVHAYVVVDAYRSTLADELWDAEEFRTQHLATFLGPKPAE